MMVPRHPHLGRHLGRHHLPPEVAANGGQTVAVAARTTPVGATGLPRIAKFAPEPSIPVPLRHRAMVMRQPQRRILQRHQHRRRHRRSQRHRHGHRQGHRQDLQSQRSIATRTQLHNSCVQAAMCAPIVAAFLALARDSGLLKAKIWPIFVISMSGFSGWALGLC